MMTTQPLFHDFKVKHRHRADLQILGELQGCVSSCVRPIARKNFFENNAMAQISEDWGQRTSTDSYRDLVKQSREVAETDGAYQIERLYQRYLGEEFFVRGMPAIEELRDQAEALLDVGDSPEYGSLELDPTIEIPRYHKDTEWHLQPGGWHDYDLVGPMMGIALAPYVLKKGGFAAVNVGDDPSAQRLAVAKMLPKSSYERIYEPGCGGIATLSAVHEVFPDAELTGSDLSPCLLKMGFAMAQRTKLNVTLKQRDAVDLREPDESFDAVITYALHHEMPVKENLAAMAEAFRILKPGGDIVISDPPPFHAIDPFEAVLSDWETKYRGEPFFSITRDIDWTAKLAEIGFVNIEVKALGENLYPYVITASKPASNDSETAN